MGAGGRSARRAWLAISGMLAAAVAVSGTFVVLHDRADDGVDRLVAAEPSPAVTTAAPALTPSAAPTSASPKPKERKATQEAAPPPSPSALPDDPTSAPPSRPSDDTGFSSELGPIPSGSVVVPYDAGRHHWSGTSHGVSMDVSMTPASPSTGELVTFTVTTSADRNCCANYIVFGNGYTAGEGPCESPHATSTTTTFTTYYNAAGRHQFLVGATVGNCSQTQGDLYGWVDIAEGTHSAQGPALPQVDFDTSLPPPGHDGDPGWLTLDGGGTDADGYVHRLIIDWGDGTTERFGQPLSDCIEGRDGWPAESELRLPSYGDDMAKHHYAEHGVYTVRLVAVSVSCEGRDEQRAGARLEYDYSA